jgi:integrase
MRRSSTALTPTICERVKANSKKQVLWDAQVLGLALVVTPKVESGGGRKTWFFVPRRDGKQIWVRIGEYQKERVGEPDGAVWTVEAARSEAGQLRKLHDQGKDVRAVVKERRTPKTMKELADHYQESTGYRDLAKGTTHNQILYLRNHILPVLGKRLVEDVTYHDVSALHQTIEGKGGISATANGCITLTGKLLRYAMKIGWRTPGLNPCTDVERSTVKARDRVLTTDEYARAFTAMVELLDAGKLNRDDADAILLTAYSGMRPGEPVAIQWPNVDLETRTLAITDHKTVKKMGTKYIPINGPMEQVFRSRQSQTIWAQNPWVFRSIRAGTTHRRLCAVEVAWRAIAERAGIEGTVLHDLRRTFSTIGVDLGYSHGVMDDLLGHKLPGVQSVYIHLTTGGILAEASSATSAWINAALNGKRPQPGKRVEAESVKEA